MENQRFGIIWQLIKIHKLYFSVSLKNQPTTIAVAAEEQRT